MDPISALVLTLIMLAVSVTIQLITWPFRLLKETAAAHPRRTARMVLGALAAGLFAYLLHAPYVIEISLAGGVAGLILDRVFS